MNSHLEQQKKSKRQFMLLHWALTLILGPVFSQAILYIWGQNPHQVVGLLEVYPISLFFSIVFSIPTLVIYLLANYYLTRLNTQWKNIKHVLITISVMGVAITMFLIKGSMSMEIASAYSASALICGLILSLVYTSNRINKNTTYNKEPS